MITYTTRINKFEKQGEKTGWTYIELPADLAQKLKPGNKKSFRVKGKLDDFSIKGIAVIPMGDGNFILALNADLRKGIKKKHGAMLTVSLEVDKEGYVLNQDLMDCLADEPDALKFFKSLTQGHQNYFSKWIESAKTEPTRAKRIANTVDAMCKKQSYSEMIRGLKKV